jgi:hypothetical protein
MIYVTNRLYFREKRYFDGNQRQVFSKALILSTYGREHSHVPQDIKLDSYYGMRRKFGTHYGDIFSAIGFR